ncbi:MAG: ABC transporter permease [Bacteroidales bacterium]|nr:ABC transporter permease [Bacteroidales bacterium]
MNNTILKPKHKHFLISTFCLMVGITAATLLFQWVLHELSYNRFVEDGDRIYRLVSVDKATGTKYPGAVCQLREDLPGAVSQVEECVAAYSQYRTIQNPCTVRDMERNESIEVKSLTTSDNFFKVFTFPLWKASRITSCNPTKQPFPRRWRKNSMTARPWGSLWPIRIWARRPYTPSLWWWMCLPTRTCLSRWWCR